MNGKAVYQFDKRPMVWVRLENPHDSSTASVDVPALVDTGADFSAIPAVFARSWDTPLKTDYRNHRFLVSVKGQYDHSSTPQN